MDFAFLKDKDLYIFFPGDRLIKVDHFTGQELDDRVAWASWYQLVHSFSRVKTTFDDPIREPYMKLKFDSPNLRAEREDYPQ